MKLDFLVIGSQKAGTTSIHQLLKQHKSVYLPLKKELKYFFHASEFEKGEAYYHSYFQDAREDQIKGEASPGYIAHPESAKRIFDYNPKIKLILTIRNPIDRAYSQYWHKRRNLKVSESFDCLLSRDLDHHLYEQGSNGLFSRGLYIEYIEQYLKYFPREQLLILDFDELKASPIKFFEKISNFLNITTLESHLFKNTVHNKALYYNNPFYKFFFKHPQFLKFYPKLLRSVLFFGRKVAFNYEPIDPSAKQTLIEYYKPYNRRLADFLGTDLSHWEAE